MLNHYTKPVGQAGNHLGGSLSEVHTDKGRTINLFVTHQMCLATLGFSPKLQNPISYLALN